MTRVTTASPWLVRWQARAPRAAVLVAVGVFCLVGVRATLAGPAAPSHPAQAIAPSGDLPAEAFAASFARAYLTWDPTRTAARERALRSFMTTAVEIDAAIQPPATIHQRVLSTDVARSDPGSGGRVVGVRVATNRGDVHLLVRVMRTDRGALAVASYPAIIGPPLADPGARPAERDEVDDSRLTATGRRVVTNYLGRSRENLAADLTGGGVVVLPTEPLRVLSIEAVEWVRRPSQIAVTVRARSRDGVRLTLTYELGVVRRAGRWLVSRMPSTSISNEGP